MTSLYKLFNNKFELNLKLLNDSNTDKNSNSNSLSLLNVLLKLSCNLKIKKRNFNDLTKSIKNLRLFIKSIRLLTDIVIVFSDAFKSFN